MFYFRYPVAGGSSDDFLPVRTSCCTSLECCCSLGSKVDADTVVNRLNV